MSTLWGSQQVRDDFPLVAIFSTGIRAGILYEKFVGIEFFSFKFLQKRKKIN